MESKSFQYWEEKEEEITEYCKISLLIEFFSFLFSNYFPPQKINYLIEAFLKMYFLLCLQGHFTYMLVLKKSHEKLGKISIEFFIFGNGLQAVAFTNWTARV